MTSIVGRVERELIQQVLQSCDRVQIKAAARLGINRNTLHKKLAEYRLDNIDSGPTADDRRDNNGDSLDSTEDDVLPVPSSEAGASFDRRRVETLLPSLPDKTFEY